MHQADLWDFALDMLRNVTIKNATFLNNLKSHFLEFGGVKNAKITGCTFSGYYKNYVEGGQECIQIDCCTDESNVFRSTDLMMERPVKIL